MKSFSLVLVLILWGGTASAQLEPLTVFRGGTELVSLSVVVTDPQQKFDIVERALEMGERTFSESEFAMKSLAQETGGRSFAPLDVAELAGVYDIIAKELASQYALGYTPKNQQSDGAYRRVVVRVSQPGARTRTRAGYIAPRAQQSPRVR